MTLVCKNCDRSFSKSYTYCPHCGQAAASHRLNFHHVTHDVIHAFIHADKGVLLLFKELTYRPGTVARLYVEGKRKKYYNPFSFLVLMVAVAVFFILKFESFAIVHDNSDPDKTRLLHFAFKYFNVLTFVMCPVSAVFIWLFFRKYHKNFIENLALVAYVSGQTMFFYCLLIIPLALFNSKMVVIGFISGCLLTCWTGMALLQFYQTWSFRNILKVICVLVILQVLSQGFIYLSFYVYKGLFL